MKIKNLKALNLSEGEIKVYSTVLELGISSLNNIQEKTGIERRNIYDILNKLIEKGFVSYTIEKGKRTYQCTHPNKIKEELNNRKEILENLEKELPEIESFFNSKKPEIRAEVYRGNESIKALLNESLNYKEQYWIGGNSGIEGTNLKIWFGHWMNQRIEKKVFMYDLVDYGSFLKKLESTKKQKNNKNYYERRELPKNLSSPMVIFIFGNKVAQILWGDQTFAFVLDSKEIKLSFMKYFEYFWKSAKK